MRESLIFRLHSKIDQIHLSIEAQCGTACLPMGDCQKHQNLFRQEAEKPEAESTAGEHECRHVLAIAAQSSNYQAFHYQGITLRGHIKCP